MFTVDKATIGHADGTTKVTVIGTQSQDGSCEHSILCDGVPWERTAAQARVIAAALLDTAGRIGNTTEIADTSN